MNKTYKKALIFILTFLGVIILDYIFFVGIFSGIPEEKTSWFLDNFVLSIILFFWLSLGIPSLASYFIVFRLHKTQPEEDEEKLSDKSKTKLALTITFSFAVIIFIFFKTVMPPKFAPYTFHPVSESEFYKPSPTPSQISPLTIPDFLEEQIKPKTIINVASWKLFEDVLVGVRFKYPPEWGEPQVVFRKGGDSGWLYRVSFPNSSFIVGGTSSDFSEGRGGIFTDFNGFGEKNKKNLFWENAQALCQEKHLLYCKIANERVHVLSGRSCGPTAIGSFQRIMFADRPERTISGLAFGGTFLSSNYNSFLQILCEVKEEDIRENFGKAILERRLDSKSMGNFDIIEKVFETVENF